MLVLHSFKNPKIEQKNVDRQFGRELLYRMCIVSYIIKTRNMKSERREDNIHFYDNIFQIAFYSSIALLY